MERTSLPEIDIRKELAEISRRGYIRSLRSDNTGIGYTLETLLGIKENNAGDPDFKYNGLPVELKAHREESSSRITLITKTPHWTPLSERQIIQRFGYPDEKGRQGLKITLTATGFNPKGFKLVLDEQNNRLNIVHNVAGVVSYFLIDEIMDVLKTKLYQNLLLVYADRKIEGDVEYFHYRKAVLLRTLSELSFKKLLREGSLVWEFRSDIRERTLGKGDYFVRDHGPGFRISAKLIEWLFEESKVIL